MSGKRIAIFASIAVHVVIAIVLVSWYLPAVDSPNSVSSAAGSSGPSDDDSADTQPPKPLPQADVPADEIAASVESQVEAASRLTDEKKLSELEKNLKRLESISSEKSVNETASTIAKSIGLDTNQYADKTPPETGKFDTDTAQLSDVTRHKTDSGEWRYESVLVDAQGRKMNVPMSAAEGESVYETFEKMNRFPMAKSIYQSVVMPMLQKMMEAQDASSQALRNAQRENAQREKGNVITDPPESYIDVETDPN